MKTKIRQQMAFILPCLVLILTLLPNPANAGTIFTDRASFLVAVGASPSAGTEDFEGFALGAVANPLTIMGGAAEIFDTSPSITLAANTVGGPSPTQAWIGNVAVPTPVGIQGVGATSLGFSALGFDFAHEHAGAWSFLNSGGIDSSGILPPGPPVLDGFVGWVGASGETLTSASYATGGIILDNMVAFSSAVPDTGSTALLLGAGLLGLAAVRRKLR